MYNPLEFNEMMTLLPHLLATFLYIFLFVASCANIAIGKYSKENHHQRQRIYRMGLVQAISSLYFITLQYYWMSVSVVGDDPTSMQIAWTLFHYINPTLQLYIALQRFIDPYVFKD